MDVLNSYKTTPAVTTSLNGTATSNLLLYLVNKDTKTPGLGGTINGYLFLGDLANSINLDSSKEGTLWLEVDSSKALEADNASDGTECDNMNWQNTKFGLSICYDLRFPCLYRELAKKGAEVILSPAAFTVPTGKDHWEILTRARAIENNVFLIATNMCGTHHKNRKTYGHSVLVSPWGKLLNKSFNKSALLNTKINLNEVKEARKKIPSLKHG